MAKQRSYENQTVESVEYQGHGIIRPEGRVVFVEGVLPGEVVDVTITRKRRDHAFARVVRWHQTSPERQEPFCSHFADCGGCTWQYLPYPAQLRYKEQFVADVLRRIGDVHEPAPLPILGCESDTYYRNKLDFSFAPVRWITQTEVDAGAEITDRRALGFHVKGRFDRVLDLEHCYLRRTRQTPSGRRPAASPWREAIRSTIRLSTRGCFAASSSGRPRWAGSW